MFEHSVKVPRQYKAAANILKQVCSEGGSIKTLIYDSKYKHFNVKSLFALVTTAVRNARALTSLFSEIQLLEKEPRLDPWLARILATEILLGKKALPGHSKPEQTLLDYKEQIEQFPHKNPELFDFKGPQRPRYVRVNTIKMCIEEFITWFEDEGYEFIPTTIGTYNDYLDQVKSLKEYQFLQDYHVKCIFAFYPGTQFHDHELYTEGKLLLQDKASALAVELLAPEKGSTVLDMCAAPGMKATQAAAYVQSCGHVYACERVYKRQNTLYDMIRLTNAHHIRLIGSDVFDVDKKLMKDVKYILLDPSCSGSGMDYCLFDTTVQDRIQKLQNLQEKLLRLAMSNYPEAERIVYSTCSLLPEENEKVVANVVKASRGRWKVRNIKEMLKGQWNNFGSGPPGSIAERCLYAKPESDLTKGFFLAVIERHPIDSHGDVPTYKQLEKEQLRDQQKKEEKLKKKKEKESKSVNVNRLAIELANKVTTKERAKTETKVEEEIKSQDELEVKKKSKKKKQKDDDNVQEQTADDNSQESSSLEVKKRKKKKRSNSESQSVNQIADNLSGLQVDEEEIPKKKRKTHTKAEERMTKAVIEHKQRISKAKKRRRYGLTCPESRLLSAMVAGTVKYDKKKFTFT